MWLWSKCPGDIILYTFSKNFKLNQKDKTGYKVGIQPLIFKVHYKTMTCKTEVPLNTATRSSG